jgi:hypothetical protein
MGRPCLKKTELPSRCSLGTRGKHARGGLRRFVGPRSAQPQSRALNYSHPPPGRRLARGTFLKRRGIGVGFSMELDDEGRTIVTPEAEQLVFEAERLRAGDLATPRQDLIEHGLIAWPGPMRIGVRQRRLAWRRRPEMRQPALANSPSRRRSRATNGHGRVAQTTWRRIDPNTQSRARAALPSCRSRPAETRSAEKAGATD